eukprot:13114458-Heterocapsa_arctica.AAC.1
MAYSILIGFIFPDSRISGSASLSCAAVPGTAAVLPFSLQHPPTGGPAAAALQLRPLASPCT